MYTIIHFTCFRLKHKKLTIGDGHPDSRLANELDASEKFMLKKNNVNIQNNNRSTLRQIPHHMLISLEPAYLRLHYGTFTVTTTVYDFTLLLS